MKPRLEEMSKICFQIIRNCFERRQKVKKTTLNLNCSSMLQQPYHTNSSLDLSYPFDPPWQKESLIFKGQNFRVIVDGVAKLRAQVLRYPVAQTPRQPAE